MTNILTILNIGSILSSNPPMEFNSFLSHGTSEDTDRFRFYVTCPNPSGSKNKGRICLDNFTVYYN